MPHVSYLISLAGADFAVYHDRVGDLPLDYYVAKHVDEATARRFMGHTPKMIRFFGEKTGQPYPYNKYAQVCVPDFVAGGMENITATTMTDSVLVDEIAALEGDADGLVAHELAHQWFGDYLTGKDWSHIWLNEGFATYFAAHFCRGGSKAMTSSGSICIETAGGYLAGDRFSRRALVEERYRSSDDMFDGVTYSKGACVLHVLRGLVGEAAWWKGIRHYVAAHKLASRRDRRLPQSDGSCLRQGPEVVLRPVGLQGRSSRAQGALALRGCRQDRCGCTCSRPRHSTSRRRYSACRRRSRSPRAQGAPRVVPILIDGRSHEFVIPCRTRPQDGRDRSPGLAAQGDQLREVRRREPVPARACRVRAGPVERGGGTDQEGEDEHRKLPRPCPLAWKREKAASARHELFAILCNGAEVFRTALVEGASDHEPRVRVAAIAGLARLRRTEKSEAVLRAAWNDSRQPYGSRKAALRGLVRWKVKDAPELIEKGLKITAGDHTIAAVALELALAAPGAKARELAALYSKYGQPAVASVHSRSVRSAGWPGVIRRSQATLIDLCDDPDRTVRLHGLDDGSPAQTEEGPAGARGPTRPRPPRLWRLPERLSRVHDQRAEGSREQAASARTPRRHRPRPSPSWKKSLASSSARPTS